MRNHLLEQLPLQKASEAEYALVANTIGVAPSALKLVMSNGVCVGSRKSGQIHLSPGALKVVKRWAGVQDSNDRSVDAPKTWKTTENKETESPNKAQRKLRTNYVLIDFVVGYYLCAEIPVFT